MLFSSQRKKIWIGFLTLITVVCLYIYLLPQKIQQHDGKIPHPSIVQFNWLPLQNMSDLTKCRNSLQGPSFITDELGFICLLPQVMSNGCCNPNHGKRFDCTECNHNSCCGIYEYCVSCCLHPDKKPMVQSILAATKQSYHPVYSIVKDQFEFCLAKCRTSSLSVHHENSYRNPNAKYCYGLDDSVLTT